MIPVTCRVAHKPEEGKYGDCLRACIASVMELDAEQVPHFADAGVSAVDAAIATRAWLATQGCALFIVNYAPDPLDVLLEMMGNLNPNCHYLLMGNTGEGDHVVVCKGELIVHNPAWVACSLKQPLERGDGMRFWHVWVIARR